MKTKTEIIIETIQFYKDDPTARRSLAPDGECYYAHSADGLDANITHCAIGRCMTEGSLKSFGDFRGDVGDLVNKAKLHHIDPLLYSEYQGHGIDFWDRLQALHDHTRYWEPENRAPVERWGWVKVHYPEALQPALDLGLIKAPSHE